ncbi:septum site-determining protein MinC [Methylosoma difficile]
MIFFFSNVRIGLTSLTNQTPRMPTEPQQQHSGPTLEFKTSTFSAPVLVIATDDLNSIEQQLQEKIEKAPDFFKNSPIILDVQGANKKNLNIDIGLLCQLVRKLKLLPIGIRGGNDEQNSTALKYFVPNYSIHHPVNAGGESKQTKSPAPKEEAPRPNTLTINQPVRSGQRIYAQGDLIILAPVNAGAEVIAEGNIHIYSSLRGKALAGVPENTEARIYCSDLQAELISIAGHYQVNDQTVPSKVKGKPVQIYLQEHALIIKDI